MRGNKIWSIALLLSLTLSMLAIVVHPVPADTVTYISAPEIENPLMAPGTSFQIDILVFNVTNLWGVDFYLDYDPSIITASKIMVNVLDPIGGYGFRETTAADIDNVGGSLHLATNRGPSGIVHDILGISDGVNKLYYGHYPRIDDRNGDGVLNAFDVTLYFNGVPQPVSRVRDVVSASGRIRLATAFPAPPAGTEVSVDYLHGGLTVDANFPIVTIAFDVVARGVSALDIHDTQVQDIYFNTMILDELDGFFDNRFQGHLTAPMDKNLALAKGDTFDLVITADNVRHPTWGVAFFLDYDTKVLTAIGADVGDAGGSVDPTPPHQGNVVIDDAAGWIYVQVAEMALTTEDPISIAIIHFKLDNPGWSTLGFREIGAVSIYGDTLYFSSTNGSFASVDVVQPAGTRTRVETRVFHSSVEEDVFETLFIPVQTAPGADGALVTLKVVFTVYNIGTGDLITTIESETLTLPAKAHIAVYGYYDTTLVAAPYKALVNTELLYDADGDGVLDSVGGPIGSVDFTVLP